MNHSSHPIDERVHFAANIDPATNAWLQMAAAAPQADRSAELLRQAADASPGSLAVDIARVKYHFYRGELELAAAIGAATLERSAGQGGFSADWRLLDAPLAGRDTSESPARYYLFALKATAFISLRSDERERAAAKLDKLKVLDPDDLVGASVIRELLDALEDDG